MFAYLGFQRLGEGTIVQRLTGLWIAFEQRHTDDCRLEVIGNETADHVRPLDIATYLFQRRFAAVIGIGDHPTGT
ncbi:hypothetical protein D3C72_2116770 [compost metagenome]